MLHIDLPTRTEILKLAATRSAPCITMYLATTPLAEIAQAARAATFGAIDTLIVDMDVVVPGTLDEESGEVAFAESPGANTYDVVDEIVSRALKSGARVVAARKDDLPGKGALAAILRYAI